MGLTTKSIEKLDDYYDRLRQEKVDKIQPKHVEEVLAKLRAKEVELLQDLDLAKKPSKKERIKSKLLVVREQIHRGEWLMQEINDGE